MNIWVDLANSPQVLVFAPILAELARGGHHVSVTTRDFAQTVPLADRLGLDHTTIGGHGGKKLSRIGAAVVKRAWALFDYARPRRFDLCVSHNSYAQALASVPLRTPFVTLMDYEHQPANHLCFRLARRVIVPLIFPEAALKKFGAHAAKTIRFDGLKEQIYLSDFVPDSDFARAVGLPPDRVIVVMRPPGSWGLYHNFENPLFDEVFKHIASRDDVHIVFLPRVPAQADWVRGQPYTNVWIPPRALDGPNLLHAADVVVSGGGTVNREAAILGTPAYSLFSGESPAVDQYLCDLGRLRHIRRSEDIPSIRLARKPAGAALKRPGLVHEIAGYITSGASRQ